MAENIYLTAVPENFKISHKLWAGGETLFKRFIVKEITESKLCFFGIISLFLEADGCLWSKSITKLEKSI